MNAKEFASALTSRMAGRISRGAGIVCWYCVEHVRSYREDKAETLLHRLLDEPLE